MNAQRSVWSSPPLTVQHKYAAYFGGFFDHREWYEYDRSRIRLWWTDAEMNRLDYRELSIPAGLLNIINGFARGLSPPLASVTHDNMILFLDVLTRQDGIRALYVVCDPERVLRYGLVPLQAPQPGRSNIAMRVLVDGGSWTWDGRYVWPLFHNLPGSRSSGASRAGGIVADLFTCRVDTEQDLAEQPILLFQGRGRYGFVGAGWVATDPQATNAVLAHTIDTHADYEVYSDDYESSFLGYVYDYTLESKYLPDGPVLLRISRFRSPGPIVRLPGTFPVGSAWAVSFEPGDPPAEENGFLRIFVGERAAVNIPIILSGYRPYYSTTSTGLPYDLRKDRPRLLRCSGSTATILFKSTRFLTEENLVDVLVEYDLSSGMAVKDIVVPSIWPEWGMEHEGAILAVPYMTSNKGRIKLP